MEKFAVSFPSELIPPPLLPINEKLDRFVIGRRISEEMLSHVYHAHDPLRNEDICLKLVNGACAPAKAVLEQEFRASNLFAACDKIVVVHDIHEFEYGPSQLIALTMEYTPDGTLTDWLEANRSNIDLRRQEGNRFLVEIINAVEHLHNYGLFHPGLHPNDILLAGGHLKLTNLANWGTNPGALLEKLGTAFDSPEYLAPESFVATKASELSFSANIYSLGTIAWQIFSDSAHPPFEGDYEQIRKKHLFLEPPLLGLEPKLEQVIQRCLHKSPTQRYQTVEELKQGLVGGREPAVDPGKDVLASLCLRLVASMNSGNVRESSALCREALTLSPERQDLQEVKRRLTSMVQRASLCMDDLRAHINDRSIPHTLGMLNQALLFQGGSTDEMQNIVWLLERRLMEYQEYVQCGQAAAARQNWSLALDYFDRAWELNRGDRLTATWRNTMMDLRAAQKDMNLALQQRNYPAALLFAENMDRCIARMASTKEP
ncbi:MAG: protein kinase [Planctomycetes bacterium]|nr:protein kinase [Planctomycetota bacterium]